MTKDDPRDNNPAFHLEGGIPVLSRLNDVEREQAEAKKRDKEYRDEQIRLDRKMVWFTGLLVLCTAVVGGINWWQASIANRSAKAAESAAKTASDSLAETKKGSTDTHTLAVAADTQSKQAIEQTEKMRESLSKTESLIAATNRLASAAKSSADTASDALIRGQRPWVGVSAAPVIVQPPSIADKQIRFTINVVTKNYGPSPALHAHTIVFARVTFTVSKTPEDRFKDDDMASRDACETAAMLITNRLGSVAASGKVEQRVVPQLGVTIFPNESVQERSVTAAGFNGGVDFDSYPRFIGCIAYGDQFKGETVHHTRFCFDNPATVRNIVAPQILTTCPIHQNAD